MSIRLKRPATRLGKTQNLFECWNRASFLSIGLSLSLPMWLGQPLQHDYLGSCLENRAIQSSFQRQLFSCLALKNRILPKKKRLARINSKRLKLNARAKSHIFSRAKNARSIFTPATNFVLRADSFTSYL